MLIGGGFYQVEVAAGAFDDKGVGVVFVIADLKGAEIHIAEIYTSTRFFINLGGEQNFVAGHDLTRCGCAAGEGDMGKVGSDAEVFFEFA